jgi:hypothetical protein
MKKMAKGQHGGARPGSGRPCLYPGKQKGVDYWMIFTPAALEILDGITERTGLSWSDILQHLVMQDDSGLAPVDGSIMYRGKVFKRRRRVRLSRDAARRFTKLQKRTKHRSPAEMAETLVRELAPRTTFPERPSKAA